MKASFVLLAMVLVPGALQAEGLGWLFYTPAQRAQLDVARSQRNTAIVPETAVETAPPGALTYSGVVRRSDGKSTVWINNRVVNDGEALAGDAVVGRVRPDGAVSVHLPHSKRAIDLKVGQTLEVDSGTVAENYARPRPAVKPHARARVPVEQEAGYSALKRRLNAARDEEPAEGAAHATPRARTLTPR